MKFSSLLSCIGVIAAPSVAAASKVPIYMYVDEWNPTPAQLTAEFVRMAEAGVSHIIMAFHLEGNGGFPTNIADTVAIWSQVSEPDRAAVMAKLHALGTKVLISSGGESEGLYWKSQDPKAYAVRACNLVKNLGVDGIDFDKEGFGWVDADVMKWINTATVACREVWPDAIITSAPQSPHMSGTGGYNWADGIVNGAAHDHYLIQYYNQGTWTADTTYEGLISRSGVGAINELRKKYGDAARPDQFVIGKPFLPSHAGSGFVELTKLREFICKAWTEEGYRGGMMFWKYAWGGDLAAVSMLAEPCDSSADADITTTSTTTSTTTTSTTTTTTTTTTPYVAPVTTAAPKPDVVETTEDWEWCPEEPDSDEVPSVAPPAPAYTTTPATTTTTRPTTTTTRTSTSTTTVRPTVPAAGSDPVADCRTMVSGGPNYAHFDSTCKDYCADYAAPSGQLAAWCPSGTTGPAIAGCVAAQRSFCAAL